MGEMESKVSRRRGQRRSSLDLPQRFVDRLTSDGLEIPDYGFKVHKAGGIDSEPDILTLERLFNRYYSARQAEGAAERTLQDYVKHMRWFRRFLNVEYNGLDNFVPNREVIRSWISHMITAQKLMPSTINIRLRTVRAMFNWAIKEGLMRQSPFENVELLRVPEEEFSVITPAQERKLFNVCDVHTLVGLRDALLMSFLLDTGVRIGECVRIQTHEVDVANRTVHIRAESAKTRKSRLVFFGPRTHKLLTVYLVWHQRNAKDHNLFLNEYGLAMDKDWATRRIGQLGDRAKIVGVRVSPHTFRHTFATRYIKATGDPFSLRRILGHTTMEMVNRYVNQTAGDVREQYEKFLGV